MEVEDLLLEVVECLASFLVNFVQLPLQLVVLRIGYKLLSNLDLQLNHLRFVGLLAEGFIEPSDGLSHVGVILCHRSEGLLKPL